MEKRQCIKCSKTFGIEAWDVQYYERIHVPAPTLCPECRQQRRLATANQLFLYKRTCAGTGKDVISNYHPDDPYIVYDQPYWFSDKWDPMQYGVNFDFSRPFFEQYHEFASKIPRPNLFTSYELDENSPYTNHAGKNKNCYMIFDSDKNDGCYYSYSINNSKNCLDCYRARSCELCYECIDCERCYGCWYLQNSQNCMGSTFLKDCVNVNNSFMCVGLRHKEYYVLNQPVSKEEFQALMNQLNSRSKIIEFQKQFADFVLKFPNKFMQGVNNDNVMGNYLSNCHAAIYCYDSNDLDNCKYFYQAFDSAKDCMDVQEVGDKAELVYDSSTLGYTAYIVQFSYNCLGNLNNFTYCQYSSYSHDLFACFGLRHKQFCIFNKQYSEEDYTTLRAKIIEHMKQTREWGENWPMQYSWFAYNETLAQDYFPLSKTEVQARGLRWRDVTVSAQPATMITLPDTVAAIDSALVKELLVCGECGRNYKFIAQEVTMYQQARIPLPLTCFYCRNRKRLQARNPRQLWQRQCMCTQVDHGHAGRCATQFETTYSPERKELVYCETCYQKEVN